MTLKTIQHVTVVAALTCFLFTFIGCSHNTKPSTQSIVNNHPIVERTPLDPTIDPHIWLEEVRSERSLAWVNEQTSRSIKRLEADKRLTGFEEQLMTRYAATDRITYARFDVGGVHNIYQDAENERGIWRRASFEDYANDTPDWETLLDFDALADEENENWVYAGRDCLTGTDRCIVRLSRGGGDAVVLREYDLVSKRFVKGGFESPEAKQWSAWMDFDRLMIATDFGEGSINEAGYPTQIRIWERGNGLSDAAILIDDEKNFDTFPFASHHEGADYRMVRQRPDIFTQRLFIVNERSNELQRVNLPETIEFQGFFKDHIVVQLHKDWVFDKSTTFPADCIVLISVENVIREYTAADVMVFNAPNNGVLNGVSIGADRIYLDVLEDVTSTLKSIRLDETGLLVESIDIPTGGSLWLVSADTEADRIFVNYSTWLEPDTLFAVEGSSQREIDRLPARFDASELIAEQKFAISKDRTKVPFSLIRRRDIPMDGSTPTLLNGYGGFQQALTPGYMNGFNSLWLENGGAYAIAHVRGGGEYGPTWHQAAVKENRQRSFDDFISVAEELVESGVTSPQHLGILGGSNGGLLVAVAFTQRPDLFNAAICAVPLLDMYRYDKLFAGASWVGEYGDPDTEDWAYIHKYSPYHNVFPNIEYPEAFFFTLTGDDRVHPAHARKMAARMMEFGHEVVYLEFTDGGGHTGGASLKGFAHLEALQAVYVLQKLSDE